jgi:hypothetical protein
MKLLGLQKMDQDEISAILHKNEAVFNPKQQDMLLKNLATAWNYTPTKTDYSNIVAKPVQPIDIRVSYGDLSFPNVRDIDDAMTEFSKQTETALMQCKSKFMR